ncbi:MAG: hypothetical protein Q8877_03635, partial [Sweet potato little leaf phytoplasma]|nr:hypothetical protein [Sweet potato little leaf phytoplasma]
LIENFLHHLETDYFWSEYYNTRHWDFSSFYFSYVGINLGCMIRIREPLPAWLWDRTEVL